MTPGWKGVVLSCRSLGPLQTMQRAEFWGTILALQAFWCGHFGVDNLNVVRSIARLHDHGCFSKP